MRILLISYDDLRYDGRVRELIRTAQELGETIYITRAEDGEGPFSEAHIVYQGSGYLGFLRFCVWQARRLSPLDIIFIDNRKGILPGYLAKKASGARYVVQDCRELYDLKSAEGLPGKFGCIVEKLFTRRADVVIAANAFRAKAMVELFHLAKQPLSYENLRRLEYRSEEKKRRAAEECGEFFKEKKFRIVSTSGCDLSRTTGKLLKAMKGLGTEYELLLVGESDEEDEIIVAQMIRDLELSNVKVFPQMDQEHLKYLIENSDVGWVAYHQRNLNNKYCASGKIFEFLSEGKPVAASTNPPLKRLCEKYGVGVADDDYERAIRALAEDYGSFKARAEDFSRHMDVERNNHRLARRIREGLKEAR